jgi:hypothetical protein
LVLALAAEYDELRRTMPASGDRTRRMTAVFSRMTAMVGSFTGLFQELRSSVSPGQRLGAIALLHMFPSARHLDWLAERLDPEREKPFVEYQAAVGLLQAVRGLPRAECLTLAEALRRARGLAERLTTDPPRIRVLDTADSELSAKCKPESRADGALS